MTLTFPLQSILAYWCIFIDCITFFTDSVLPHPVVLVSLCVVKFHRTKQSALSQWGRARFPQLIFFVFFIGSLMMKLACKASRITSPFYFCCHGDGQCVPLCLLLFAPHQNCRVLYSWVSPGPCWWISQALLTWLSTSESFLLFWMFQWVSGGLLKTLLFLSVLFMCVETWTDTGLWGAEYL